MRGAQLLCITQCAFNPMCIQIVLLSYIWVLADWNTWLGILILKTQPGRDVLTFLNTTQRIAVRVFIWSYCGQTEFWVLWTCLNLRHLFWFKVPCVYWQMHLISSLCIQPTVVNFRLITQSMTFIIHLTK